MIHLLHSFFSVTQYLECHFCVGGLDLLSPLLYVVGWVRLLTVQLVICIHVILVWHMKDAESIPQFTLKLNLKLKLSMP